MTVAADQAEEVPDHRSSSFSKNAFSYLLIRTRRKSLYL